MTGTRSFRERCREYTQESRSGTATRLPNVGVDTRRGEDDVIDPVLVGYRAIEHPELHLPSKDVDEEGEQQDTEQRFGTRHRPFPATDWLDIPIAQSTERDDTEIEADEEHC